MRYPQTYACWYGKTWYQTCDYWNSSIVSYNDLVKNLKKEENKFHYGGTGGSVIDTSIFNDKSLLWDIPNDLPTGVSVYNIEDLWLSSIMIYYYNWTIQRTFLTPIIIYLNLIVSNKFFIVCILLSLKGGFPGKNTPAVPGCSGRPRPLPHSQGHNREI